MVERITDLCNEHEISITSLEQKIGIARGSIRAWGRVIPSVDKLKKVADFFGVTTDYLIGASDHKYSVGETDDIGLVSLQRARSKMSEAEKKKMDDLMSLAFSEFFKEDDNLEN